ncbi:hypothetical protein FAGKG844_200045 [Frankia sp. AgKG'84/4]
MDLRAARRTPHGGQPATPHPPQRTRHSAPVQYEPSDPNPRPIRIRGRRTADAEPLTPNR